MRELLHVAIKNIQVYYADLRLVSKKWITTQMSFILTILFIITLLLFFKLIILQ